MSSPPAPLNADATACAFISRVRFSFWSRASAFSCKEGAGCLGVASQLALASARHA